MPAHWPPGPQRRFWGPLIAPGRDPLALFMRLARTYGDIAHVRFGREHLFLLSHPDLIRDVLVTNQRFYGKSRALQRARKLLGDGLLTAEGPTHLNHRRLIQPAFHRDRINRYADTMVSYATRACDSWREGETLDIATEMARLTLAVVGKTLFDADVENQAGDIGTALTDVLDSFWITLLPLADVIEQLPVPVVRRAQASRRRLDRIIYDMIASRRAAGTDRGDLLSMLLQASDETGRLTDREVRDEAMTLLLAGHETTANALAWTWYLIGCAPAVEAMLHDEVDRVLNGLPPTSADVESLPFVRRVVTESMRLFPPAWVVGRRAVEDVEVGGYTFPAGSVVFMSQWVVHRDERFFADPEEFRPDRWTPEFTQSLPKFAYFPFGGGSRSCVGEPFAWMELVLMVATIAQRWRFEIARDQTIATQPVITLRPKNGIRGTPVLRNTRRS